MYKSGMTRMFLSFKMTSASGVVGPLAPSAMIFKKSNFKIIKTTKKNSEIIYLSLDATSVVLGDLLLAGSWYEDVAWLAQQLHLVLLVWLSAWEALNGAVL
jgi:hypothetical protein